MPDSMKISLSSQQNISTKPIPLAAWIAITSIVYFISLKLGLLFVARPENVALVWPASGVAVAAVLLRPKREWSAVLAAVFLTNIVGNILSGNPMPVCLVFASGNTFETFLCCVAIAKLSRNKADFSKVSGVIALAVASVLAVGAASFAGSASMLLASGAPIMKTWPIWWVADALGIVLITPAIFSLKNINIKSEADWIQKAVSLALVLLIAIVTWLVFSPSTTVEELHLNSYAVFPLLIIAAMRSGRSGVSISLLVFGSTAIASSFAGLDQIQSNEVSWKIHILSLQMIVGVSSVTMLTLAAVAQERRSSEIERLKTAAQLAQSQKMESVGRLASGVAHDFNNILAVIKGAAQLASFELESDSIAGREQQVILKTVNRAKELTSKLLTFAREEHSIHLEKASVNDLVNETSMMIDRTAPSSVAIVKKLCDEDVYAMIDGNQLCQALINICNNSIDAMDGEGELVFETGCAALTAGDCEIHDWLIPGKYVYIKIGDSGCGMTAETMSRIFDPFYTTKAPGKGTGLGLSVTRGLVKSHGGHISLKSEPGRGTDFYVWLPVETGDTKSDQPGASGDAGSKYTILVADDEPYVLEMTEKVLRMCGYHTIGVSLSSMAIEEYRKNHAGIHAVLMDYFMPEMKAEETLKSLREINPDAKVIVTSGYCVDENVSSIMRSGARAYIQKPFDAEDLAELVASVLADQNPVVNA